MKTTVLTEDLWSALDALDAVPEAQQTDWYKRLEEAADAAMLVDEDLMSRSSRARRSSVFLTLFIQYGNQK